jgi:hypothetical protein
VDVAGMVVVVVVLTIERSMRPKRVAQFTAILNAQGPNHFISKVDEQVTCWGQNRVLCVCGERVHFIIKSAKARFFS